MPHKDQRSFRKRSFSEYKKSQQITESRQKYFEVLPLVTLVLELFVSIVLIGCAIKFHEAFWFFIILWIIATSVLVGGLCFAYWVRKKLFSTLLGQRELRAIYHSMNPLDFEHYVAERFRKAGYTDVQVTKSMGDGGIDITMNKKGSSYAVQCKKYHPDSFVKIDELRAFIYAYRRAKKERGIFVTTAKYSVVAQREMGEEGVELIDGSRLLEKWSRE